MNQEAVLGYFPRFYRPFSAAVCLLLLGGLARAQSPSKITLETSETVFSFFAALNSCGYDQELAQSDPVRAQVRKDFTQLISVSEDAARDQRQICSFYNEHQPHDPTRNIAQYVSLALNTSDPPQFKVTVKEADLPPDASNVLGFLTLLQRIYDDAGLHKLWLKYEPAYQAQVEQLHDPVANMIQSVDVYLRLPISGYVGRRFAVYLDPQIAPGQVNARNYAADYLMVVAPVNGTIRMDQVRHTYLHYILDPLALKRANRMQRLKPLLENVSTAPLDQSFKNDIALLVTESLIRAVEARTLAPSVPRNLDRKEAQKQVEAQRLAAAEADMQEGYILTRYFYDALVGFEKESNSFRDAFPDMLFAIDLPREQKRAQGIKFASEGSSELVRSASLKNTQGLDLAEQKLAAGDIQGAQEIAQDALDKQSDDPARALFLLARAASLNKDMTGARTYFERTLQAAREPRILAWSHIYLGRIYDLQENREAALMHYNAALNAGDSALDTKSAAQRGLQKAYEPPVKREQPQ
jgi:tetratricopeptide (TPR) repeat protein